MSKPIEPSKNNEKSNYEKIIKRRRVQVFFTEPSLTKQEYKDDVDLNIIIKKYQQTGELPEPRQGYYADVSEIPNYQQALDIVRLAKESFMTLPAKVRSEFENDPGAMLKWLENPENRPRAIELGLIEGDTSKQPQSPNVGDSKAVKNEVKGETVTAKP